MIHCHNLSHEDHDMMTQYQVGHHDIDCDAINTAPPRSGDPDEMEDAAEEAAEAAEEAAEEGGGGSGGARRERTPGTRAGDRDDGHGERDDGHRLGHHRLDAGGHRSHDDPRAGRPDDGRPAGGADHVGCPAAPHHHAGPGADPDGTPTRRRTR
jgi:hypothetical protein